MPDRSFSANGHATLLGRAVLVVTLILAVTSFILVLKVTGFSKELRDASIDGCQRQNVIRKNNRIEIHDQIIQNQGLQPSDFPGFSPARFEALLKAQHARQIASLKRNRPVACVKVYP